MGIGVLTASLLIIDYISRWKMTPDVGQTDVFTAKENNRLISLFKLKLISPYTIHCFISNPTMFDCHKNSARHDTCRGRLL